MLEVYTFILSIFLICLSVKFFHEIQEIKQYAINVLIALKNFFFVFIIILFINLLSVSIIKNITQNITKIDVVNIASTVDNYDINNTSSK